MIEISMQGRRFPARITGRLRDGDFDGRDSKSITMAADYATAAALFQDGAPWAIVVGGAAGETVYDNTDFCVVGDITVHRDGTVTVKMGRLTALEKTLETIYGGETQ